MNAPWRWWVKAIVVAVLIGTLVGACTVAAVAHMPPPPSPTDNLPPGAVLVYSNMGGYYPVRTVRIGDCLYTEKYDGGQWLLLNRAFLGADPAIECD